MKSICRDHFADYAIKEFIEHNGKRNDCGYCNIIANIIEIDELAKFIEDGLLFEAGLHLGEMEGMIKQKKMDLNFPIPNKIYTLEEMIKRFVKTEERIQTDLAASIKIKEWVLRNEFWMPGSAELMQYWMVFCSNIKHYSRFMYFYNNKISDQQRKEGDPYSYDILEILSNGILELGLLENFKMGALRIFRARQNKEDISSKGDTEISAPPVEKTIASRMSPAGIEMLYAAFEMETAIIEIIDLNKIDDYIIWGELINNKGVTLIDFTKLYHYKVSIFDKEKRLKNSMYYDFLKSFVEDLRKPISNDGIQHIEYAPTQVVSEFFRMAFSDTTGRKIDGFIYPSAKNKTGKCCAFFRGSTSLSGIKEDGKTFFYCDPKKIRSKKVYDINITVQI